MSGLSAWCLRHYDVLHDFAAPLATVIAAGAAVFVTWKLGSRQAQIAGQQATTAKLQAAIAKQQADTALDRLRYDLFERRHFIYRTVHEILSTVVSNAMAAGSALDIHDIALKLLVLDEARFFFPPRICDFLETLHGDVEHVMQLRLRHLVSTSSTAAEMALAGDELVSALQRLDQTRRNLPAIFEDALSFRQLIRPPS